MKRPEIALAQVTGRRGKIRSNAPLGVFEPEVDRADVLQLPREGIVAIRMLIDVVAGQQRLLRTPSAGAKS